MKKPSILSRRAPLAAAIAALVLSGCATFSEDGGMSQVSDLTQPRIGQPVQRTKPASDLTATPDAVKQLLAQPLTADTAVQAALLNNPGLQASLAELGIAEADLVQSGRLRNPGFAFGRLRGDEVVEFERSIMFDIASLVTLPLRRNIEGRRFEQAKLQAASQAIRLAADTRRAYFSAVAAVQTVQYMEEVRTSAEAGAELGRRMAEVGNWSKLDQAREQAFYADASAQLARARHNATIAREQLARLLGLPASTAIRLPDRLPDLPKAPTESKNVEQQAMEQRLDVQMARLGTEATASALGLTKATGFLNVFEVGYQNKSETGESRADGYEIELVLPIFDWGGARTARAEAAYMQAVHRTADVAVRARSQVREAYSAYRTTYDLSTHYRDEIVPLRKRISDEMVLRYNGMLIGVFELLADARAQINSVSAAIDAQRDFWIAETALQAAINGSGGDAGFSQIAAQPAAQAAPEH